VSLFGPPPPAPCNARPSFSPLLRRLRLADGNVASGQGIIQKLPVTALSSAPAESAVAWTHLQTDHYTFKSARTLTDGSVIGLCWHEVGYAGIGGGWARQATLVYLSSSGSVTWGPIGFGMKHGEGTSVRRAMRHAISQIGVRPCSLRACVLAP
jgi:hypothetical protein